MRGQSDEPMIISQGTGRGGGLGTKGKMGFWTEELHGRGDKGTKHPTPISLNEHFPAGPDRADESSPQTPSEYLVLLPFPSPFPLLLPLLQKDPSDHLHDTRVFPVCLPSSCIYTLPCPEHALSPPSRGDGGASGRGANTGETVQVSGERPFCRYRVPTSFEASCT